ncbi:hypothetical protein FACS1894202_04320 [Clostridia bacterium]|nr:hypothetical protein FACS1894202_04320 [Clostridia bacterium]
MKKIYLLSIICYLLSVLAACSPKYEKFEYSYPDVFDIDGTLTGYALTAADFNAAAREVKLYLWEADRLFDIYNNYDGINNLKTINDNAGIAPVTVDPMITDLLTFARQAYDGTDGRINVALGPVLSIWHRYREANENTLPDINALREAAKLCDINDVVIDGDTVFLKKRGMSLDVGALAKGYAAELAIRLASEGAENCLLDLGGNVVVRGKPLDGRDHWSIGIMNPGGGDLLDTVPMNDGAVVSSGSYQRYYTVDGKRYGHIIDPATLMPPDRYEHVSIVCDDSKVGELLSTALFIADRETGEKLAAEWGASALWYYADGHVETTDDWKGQR